MIKEPKSIILNGVEHSVIKVVYQPRIQKTILMLDNNLVLHLECNTVLASAGGQPSGGKLCHKYICRKCHSTFTDIDKEYVPKGQKYVVSNMQVASDKT